MTAYGPDPQPLSHRPLLELDQDAIRCSHRYFQAMAEQGPVYEVPELGVRAVARYEDVLDVLRSPERFSSAMPTGPQAGEALAAAFAQVQDQPEILALLGTVAEMIGGGVLVNADPPVHTRQRGLVSRAFTPRRVASMEGHIRDIANRLVDDFVSAGHVELVSQMAAPLPLIVIAEALGVPREDLVTFRRWSEDIVAAIGNPSISTDGLVSMIRSQAEFAEYFSAKIVERRADPRDDLISDVVHSRADGEALSDGEMLGMFLQFLVAGNETTTKLITSAVKRLLDDPDLLAEVRGDLRLVPGLVEEVLRLDSPVQAIFRTATADTEVAGQPVAGGSHLMLAYVAANRDPAVFPDPERLDPQREYPRPHLAFGQGPHFCLGASLARAEARVALETLLARLDGLRYADGNPFEYEASYIHHGLKELHVRFDGS